MLIKAARLMAPLSYNSFGVVIGLWKVSVLYGFVWKMNGSHGRLAYIDISQLTRTIPTI